MRSRSQSHARKLHKQWVQERVYWYMTTTPFRTWSGGPTAFPPENLPREQASTWDPRRYRK